MLLAGGARALVEAPPRHGKSELVSVWLAFWYLCCNPSHRIIFATYEADLAAQFGRKVRDLVVEHGALFGLYLRGDSKAANRWDLTTGGGMQCAGVRGAITGKGCDLLLIDDPVKNADEARSPTFRRNVWDWWESTAYTRLEPGGSALIIMTRWHEDDLGGRVLKGDDGFLELRLPAVAEEGDPMGREVGEPLWPERYSRADMARIEKAVGPRVWFALYQQRPSPQEGGQVKRAWFNHYDKAPDSFEQVIQSWDLPFKGKKESTWVVGQVWGRLGAGYYLLDSVRGKMAFPEQLRAFESLSKKWPEALAKLVEEKANGAALISTLEKNIPGIIPITPKGSKEARLEAVTPLFEARNIWLPPEHYGWVKEYKEELVMFPNGPADDQVDSTTQALLYWQPEPLFMA